MLHTIRETPPNKHGLCALSTDSDHCYLAYPGHSTVGELQIFDALNLVRAFRVLLIKKRFSRIVFLVYFSHLIFCGQITL